MFGLWRQGYAPRLCWREEISICPLLVPECWDIGNVKRECVSTSLMKMYTLMCFYYCHYQMIRGRWLNQLTRQQKWSYCWIPGDVVVGIRKEGAEEGCRVCQFWLPEGFGCFVQRGNLEWILGLGGVNPALFPLHAKSVQSWNFQENGLGIRLMGFPVYCLLYSQLQLTIFHGYF